MSVSALPEGWKRHEVKRTNGLSGKIDVYYISPRGDRIKSKMELAKYVGPNVDLTSFDYRSGKINPVLLRKSSKRLRNGVYDYRSLKNDPSLTVPTRQTASIFKKPVTFFPNKTKSPVYSTQQVKDFCREANIAFNEPKSDQVDKPYQIFWHKRLENKSAYDTDMDKIENFSLPNYIKSFSSVLSNNDTMLRSITTSLHLNLQTTRGQEASLKRPKKNDDDDIVRNPVAFLNPLQPVIQQATITEENIRSQESAVLEARNKLISAIEKSGGIQSVN